MSVNGLAGLGFTLMDCIFSQNIDDKYIQYIYIADPVMDKGKEKSCLP